MVTTNIISVPTSILFLLNGKTQNEEICGLDKLLHSQILILYS